MFADQIKSRLIARIILVLGGNVMNHSVIPGRIRCGIKNGIRHFGF